MGADRGQATAPPSTRPARRAVRATLEPQHGRAEDLARGQEFTQPGLDRAQVLTDRQRVRPCHLGGHHPAQQFVVIPHVGALAGRHTGGYPPEPGQRHDVVHPHAARVPCCRRDQVAYGPARLRGEAPRMPRRQRPVLSALVEPVRRSAHADARHDHVLPGPGVGTAGMRADREVGDDADIHTGLPRGLLCRGRLLRYQPLQPGMEADPVRPRPPELCHRRRTGIGERRGP